MPEPVRTLRCRFCRKMFRFPTLPPRHGDLCECGSGRLENIAKPSRRMWAEHERAPGMRP